MGGTSTPWLSSARRLNPYACMITPVAAVCRSDAAAGQGALDDRLTCADVSRRMICQRCMRGLA